MKIRLNLAVSEAPCSPPPRRPLQRSLCILLISFALGFCFRCEVLQSDADKKPDFWLRRALGRPSAAAPWLARDRLGKPRCSWPHAAGSPPHGGTAACPAEGLPSALGLHPSEFTIPRCTPQRGAWEGSRVGTGHSRSSSVLSRCDSGDKPLPLLRLRPPLCFAERSPGQRSSPPGTSAWLLL